MSPIVQALEQGGLNVVRRDWRENITEDLKEGNIMLELALEISSFLCSIVRP